MDNPPDGFTTHRLDAGWAVLRDDLAQALLDAGIARPDELPCDDAAVGRSLIDQLTRGPRRA